MPDRTSGILLHISSLPSQFGIGDLGSGAYQFVDFLNKTKQHYWQILPINPTDAVSGHSPYSSCSAFAANILFISPQLLIEDGLLTEEEADVPEDFSKATVQYDVVVAFKEKVLNCAYRRFKTDPAVRKTQETMFKEFVSANQYWIEDYALFMTIKNHFQGKCWLDWPKELRYRKREALDNFAKEHGDELAKVKFFQYLFFSQWDRLKSYCQEKNVYLFGDLSIYMNLDSVDVWRYPQNYKLDEQLNPVVVAGVPPDYFSETGQRWGNPVYDWDNLKKSQFSWWVDRLKFNFQLFDTLRIDHFRGLVQCWEIPGEEETAVNGTWADVPTDDLFEKLKQSSEKPLAIIAEDLGYITDDVRDAMRRFGFPGMKVLLFAFNGDLQQHPYLPHNYKDRCVVYTGTHDNNTVLGWFQEEASEEEICNLKQYIGKNITSETVCWDLIGLAFGSDAEIAIIPMQDLLELKADARMNHPGTSGNKNWRWRLVMDEVNEPLITRLSNMASATGRVFV